VVAGHQVVDVVSAADEVLFDLGRGAVHLAQDGEDEASNLVHLMLLVLAADSQVVGLRRICDQRLSRPQDDGVARRPAVGHRVVGRRAVHSLFAAAVDLGISLHLSFVLATNL
jgi:hypothetical protein